MTSILNPDAETVERTIEGTVFENFVKVFGSDTTDDEGRRWLPGRGTLPAGSGGSSEGGLSGPFLLVDLGAIVDSFRGSGAADVGESAAEIATDPDEGTSGRSTLTKIVVVGTALGVAYALSSRVRSVDEPVDETESIARKAANTIQQRGELAADRLEEGSRTVAQRIDEGTDRTTDRVDEATETVETVEEKASETVEDVEEGASELAEDVEENASELAEDVREDVDEAAEDVEEGASELAEDVQEDVDEAADDVEADVEEASDDVLDESSSDAKYET